MSVPLPITVLIAAKNEAANIQRCLAALSAFARVVVIDSQSTDDTAALAQRHGAEVIQFRYQGGYPKKRQWALDSVTIETPWVLMLDADEVVPERLLQEIREAIAQPNPLNAYLITKGFHFLGRRFRFGGFSHAAIALFRTGTARFEHLVDEPSHALDMEVHERLIVDGPVGRMRTPLIHEDFKGLEAYLDRHNKYSTWEAGVRDEFARTGRWGSESIVPRLFGNPQEQRRFLKSIAMRVPGEEWLWFAYHFVIRGGFLEGRRGLIASRIRAHYISDVRAKAYELRLRNSANRGASPEIDPVTTMNTPHLGPQE